MISNSYNDNALQPGSCLVSPQELGRERPECDVARLPQHLMAQAMHRQLVAGHAKGLKRKPPRCAAHDARIELANEAFSNRA